MTTLMLSMARVTLLLYTTCKRFIFSPHNSLLVSFHLVVIAIFLLYRINSKHTVQQAPLFSFPSFSLPLVSLASISLSSLPSLSQPLVSLPSISLPNIFGAPPIKKYFALPETVVASPPPKPDRNICARVEASDEEGNMSMEDAWNKILASGSAKPVKLKNNERTDRSPERVAPKAKVKNSVIAKKKKEKQAQKIEEKSEGWRHRDALVILHDDLSRRAEAFIKKQKDYLKLQREESNQHRLFEKMGINENVF